MTSTTASHSRPGSSGSNCSTPIGSACLSVQPPPTPSNPFPTFPCPIFPHPHESLRNSYPPASAGSAGESRSMSVGRDMENRECEHKESAPKITRASFRWSIRQFMWCLSMARKQLLCSDCSKLATTTFMCPTSPESKAIQAPASPSINYLSTPSIDQQTPSPPPCHLICTSTVSSSSPTYNVSSHKTALVLTCCASQQSVNVTVNITTTLSGAAVKLTLSVLNCKYTPKQVHKRVLDYRVINGSEQFEWPDFFGSEGGTGGLERKLPRYLHDGTLHLVLDFELVEGMTEASLPLESQTYSQLEDYQNDSEKTNRTTLVAGSTSSCSTKPRSNSNCCNTEVQSSNTGCWYCGSKGCVNNVCCGSHCTNSYITAKAQIRSQKSQPATDVTAVTSDLPPSSFSPVCIDSPTGPVLPGSRPVSASGCIPPVLSCCSQCSCISLPCLLLSSEARKFQGLSFFHDVAKYMPTDLKIVCTGRGREEAMSDRRKTEGNGREGKEEGREEPEQKEIWVSKHLLAARSKVFAAALRGDNFVESKLNVIDIRDFSYDVMRNFVHFVNTDSCEMLNDCNNPDVMTLLSLLEAAHKYDFKALEQTASVCVGRHLKPEYCLPILKVAKLARNRFLKFSAMECMERMTAKEFYLANETSDSEASQQHSDDDELTDNSMNHEYIAV